MTKGPVTASDVEWAIGELEARHERPTVVRVRELLGRGSFTTISKHLKRLRSDGGPPPPMPEPLQAAVAALHQRVQEQAEQDIAQIEADAARRIEAAEQETAAAVRAAEARADIAEARLEEVRRQLEVTEARTAQLQAALEQRERRAGALQAELGQAQGQLTERELRIIELERERAAGEARLEELAHAHAEALARLRDEHAAEEQRWQGFAESQIDALYKRMDAERLAAREREREHQHVIQQSAASIALLKNELSRLRRQPMTPGDQDRQRWRRRAGSRQPVSTAVPTKLAAALDAIERRLAAQDCTRTGRVSRRSPGGRRAKNQG